MRTCTLVMSLAALALAGGAFPGGASAQAVRAVPSAVRPADSALSAIDPQQLTINRLQSRITRLENKTTALQATLDQMNARTTYTCVDQATSRSGTGVTEDCTPLACNPIDGRCRIHTSGSGQCAQGYLFDGVSQCITPEQAQQRR